MCRNHSHVTALQLGQVVLTPHGWMQSYRVLQELTVQSPTGVYATYPPGTIFYVPSLNSEEYALSAIPPMEGLIEVPPSWTDEEPTYTATILIGTTMRSADWPNM